MMSSGVNPINANDSTMPGDYESWPAPAARNALLSGPPQPMVPPTRTPFPQVPPAQSTAGPPGRTPFPRLPAAGRTAGLSIRQPPIVPGVHHRRSRRHRRRPLTPDIVVHRRHHSHSSWGRHRVITIPLDHRPTLGLRGPPKRVIEIKRVRCHRRRRSPSICYEYDYDHPPPPPPPPPHPIQPLTIVANPIANPGLPLAQPSFVVPVNNTATTAPSAFFSNLTQETIDTLPRQTVHLPPIHLPGSQADADTGVHTVTFPAEIINPITGTLSIIQGNPNANHVGTTNIQPIPAAPIQPQLINIPTTGGVPVAPRGLPVSPATGSDPLGQRLHELFQRLSIPQTQPMTRAPNTPIIRPTLPSMSQFEPRTNTMNNLPTMSQFEPRNNTMNNLPTISSINTANRGDYPSSNIQPTNPLNTGSYRPANITPSGPVSNMTYRPANITPSGPVNNMTYRPANIAPYRPPSFTPSSGVNNTTYRPPNITTSDASDIGPYRPANITPYANTTNRSTNNPFSQSSFSSGPTAYSSAPSLASTSTFTPFPRLSSFPSGPGNNSMNPSSSSTSLAPTLNQSINSTPKSILRNGSSTGLPNTTTYTRLNSPSVMSSSDTIRKTTRFT